MLSFRFEKICKLYSLSCFPEKIFIFFFFFTLCTVSLDTTIYQSPKCILIVTGVFRVSFAFGGFVSLVCRSAKNFSFPKFPADPPENAQSDCEGDDENPGDMEHH